MSMKHISVYEVLKHLCKLKNMKHSRQFIYLAFFIGTFFPQLTLEKINHVDKCSKNNLKI